MDPEGSAYRAHSRRCQRRQLPDELRHTDVFEVNDLADGLLVVGILVQPVARVNAYSKFSSCILVQPVARAAGAVGRHTPRGELPAGHTLCSRMCSLFCCRMCSLGGRICSFLEWASSQQQATHSIVECVLYRTSSLSKRLSVQNTFCSRACSLSNTAAIKP